jgi:hypothetical protein
LGVGLTTPSRKKKLCYGNLEDASEGFNIGNRDEWRRALRKAKARKGL